jgi:hypothetical protein
VASGPGQKYLTSLIERQDGGARQQQLLVPDEGPQPGNMRCYPHTGNLSARSSSGRLVAGV